MPKSVDLVVILAFEDSEVLNDIQRHFSLQCPTPLPPYSKPHVVECTCAGLSECFEQATKHQSAVLLISDSIVDEEHFNPTTTSVFRDIQTTYPALHLASIAITDASTRIPDIDRTVALEHETAEFHAALTKCYAKLAYLAVPARESQLDSQILDQLLDDATRLRKYFEFRHETYSIMCYLPHEVESADLDIDCYDRSSLHLGIYHQDTKKGFEKLIATGRLVIAGYGNPRTRTLIRRIAASDPVIKNHEQQAVTLQLPVFQSHDMTDLVIQSLDEKRCVAEISRVIVHPEWRGYGLSTRVVESLITMAEKHKVSDVLLECLPLHEPVYRKCNFRRLAGMTGRVFQIDRTMIVMGRSLEPDSLLSRTTIDLT